MLVSLHDNSIEHSLQCIVVWCEKFCTRTADFLAKAIFNVFGVMASAMDKLVNAIDGFAAESNGHFAAFFEKALNKAEVMIKVGARTGAGLHIAEFSDDFKISPVPHQVAT